MGDAMKRILLAGTALLALTAAQPTLAADAPVYKGPAPIAAAALFNWSGFYIGINGGYAWGNATLSEAPPPAYNGPPDFSYRPNGFQGGLHAGVNWQASALVFGIEGELGYLGLSGSQQFPPYVGVRTAADSVAATSGGWFASIAGRVGFAVNNFLLYAKGGGIWANIGNSFTDTDPIGLTLVAGTTVSGRTGWLAGAGVEVAVNPNLTARIDWTHYDFGTASHTATASNAVLYTFRHRLTADSVRLFLSWKM